MEKIKEEEGLLQDLPPCGPRLTDCKHNASHHLEDCFQMHRRLWPMSVWTKDSIDPDAMIQLEILSNDENIFFGEISVNRMKRRHTDLVMKCGSRLKGSGRWSIQSPFDTQLFRRILFQFNNENFHPIFSAGADDLFEKMNAFIVPDSIVMCMGKHLRALSDHHPPLQTCNL